MTVNNFDIIKQLLKFKDRDDFYFLQIIQRKKDGNTVNAANNKDRTIKSYYIRSADDFERRKPMIIQLCEQNNARAYINLNVRSAKEVAMAAAKDYIDLVTENRCEQGHRVYDHVCGITPKRGNKKKWIVDIDELPLETIQIICDKINQCRSAQPIEGSDLYDNVICNIQTVYGYHIITHGFDIAKFKHILEEIITERMITPEQFKEIIDVKKDRGTLLYFSKKEIETEDYSPIEKVEDNTETMLSEISNWLKMNIYNYMWTTYDGSNHGISTDTLINDLYKAMKE